MNNLASIATVAVGVVAVFGGVAALIAWFYKRGGHERAIVDALTDNTKANRELSGELRDFKAETLAELRDHDWRLKIIERGNGAPSSS